MQLPEYLTKCGRSQLGSRDKITRCYRWSAIRRYPVAIGPVTGVVRPQMASHTCYVTLAVTPKDRGGPIDPNWRTTV